MGTDKDFFSKVEHLCQSGEPRYHVVIDLPLPLFISSLFLPLPHLFSLSFRIIAAVRTLLALIPINQKVLEALEVFIHPMSSEGASEDPNLPSSPEAVLNEYYDASNISPTLLLYNLEVG